MTGQYNTQSRSRKQTDLEHFLPCFACARHRIISISNAVGRRRPRTSERDWASDMNDCFYVLEGIGIVTLMQRCKLERFKPVASIRERGKEALRPSWSNNCANLVASLQQLRSDVTTNKASSTCKL